MNANSAPNDAGARLTVLETRFDTILPTLATKHDLALMEARILADVQATNRWLIGLIVAMLLGWGHVSYQLATRLPPPVAAAPSR